MEELLTLAAIAEKWPTGCGTLFYPLVRPVALPRVQHGVQEQARAHKAPAQDAQFGRQVRQTQRVITNFVSYY